MIIDSEETSEETFDCLNEDKEFLKSLLKELSLEDIEALNQFQIIPKWLSYISKELLKKFPVDVLLKKSHIYPNTAEYEIIKEGYEKIVQELPQLLKKIETEIDFTEYRQYIARLFVYKAFYSAQIQPDGTIIRIDPKLYQKMALEKAYIKAYKEVNEVDERKNESLQMEVDSLDEEILKLENKCEMMIQEKENEFKENIFSCDIYTCEI